MQRVLADAIPENYIDMHIYIKKKSHTLNQTPTIGLQNK